MATFNRMGKYVIVLLLVLLTAGLSYGQAINDNIENRIDLTLNAAPFVSNTTGCTVEKSCVSESLKDNCIKFHNDQWFQFTTAAAGTYYLNISGQDCRDIRGVQLLVLDGIPCQPETYKIINCVSTSTQDDIYLQADSLKANYTYLVNVDGYLHDFCAFSIAFSTRPKGIPAKPQPSANNFNAQLQDQTVSYTWTVTAEQAQDYASYRILRRYAHEARFTQISSVPHQRDSYGNSVRSYSGADTLRIPGPVDYKLLAERPDGSLEQLGEQQFIPAILPAKTQQSNQHVVLQLNYRQGTPISIYVFQAATKQLLKTASVVASKQNKQLRIPTKEYKARGIDRIEVKVTDHKRKQSRSHYFDI